jgi:hypothetical protein
MPAEMAVVALALATFVGCLWLAPAVVNGDGLGYLKAAATGGALYPGHLAYLPLVRAARALAGAGPRPVDGLTPARLVSALAAALAVAALGAAARRWRCASPAVAAAGLAASHGLWAAGSDVETYAPALAALCLALYALARRSDGGGLGWSLAAAAATALGALLHVENLLFALPAALLVPRRDRPPLVAVLGALVGVAYAAALRAHGVGWLGLAAHGLRYPLSTVTPLAALYGAGKALVFAPYLYEASLVRVAIGFSLGTLALGALCAIVAGGRAPLGRAATLAWAAPYAAVGVAFFASDAERWVFLLPLAWLAAAAAPGRRRHALALAALLVAVNLVSWLPRAHDSSWRTLAAAAGRHARAGDLVISPGHGWDEYIGFYDGPAVEPFPLVYYAGALGGRDPLARALADAIARARARGAAVLLARLVDDGDPMGWKELVQLGVTPADAAALLPTGRRVALGDRMERLDF